MTHHPYSVSRRTVLRGLTVSMALRGWKALVGGMQMHRFNLVVGTRQNGSPSSSQGTDFTDGNGGPKGVVSR